ncbi:NAD(P)-binding domain protein [Podospora aff. communis PSN243]|uniref:NAD(P)-binding domain protein n=1 Tax=Podospora aff. communis PSN243 TaxID=3040156 RepID=A0AAV9H4W7_9PEZI|nr:NAD(P)-binding domain protein [Podospora aff. communis PSN243]
MTDTSINLQARPITVLVIGASGYLGTGVCNAFLRVTGSPPGSRQFQVFGLVRRESAAQALAATEVIPVVGSLAHRDALRDQLLSHSPIWDVIVTCTEPSRADPEAETKHWDDILVLVQSLAASSFALGTRTMVLWSSGCKDYGATSLHGALDLAPHTEESPLQDNPIIRGRTNAAIRALKISTADNGAAGFDVAILRATPICGYSGSYYGGTFDYAAAFAAATQTEKLRVLKFATDANTIIHGVHLDDCGDAYVALANAALFGGDDPDHGRPAIAGQAFNISGRRYETLNEIGAALAKEYGFDGVQFGVSVKELPEAVSNPVYNLVFGWSQWVASDKIRRVTGWTDRRPLFVENLHIYRLAYEAAAEAGSANVESIKKRLAGNWD